MKTVTLALLLWSLHVSNPVSAQPVQVVPAAQGESEILALAAGPDSAGELVRYKSTGERISSKTLPMAALALCTDATGTVVAPADGGLAVLDSGGLVKVRTRGMVYESLVCAGGHVYAAGRSLRVHRFDLPGLLNRTTVYETNNWNPRLLSPKGGLLAGASWDGSVTFWTIADATRRSIPGKTSLLDLVAGPNDTWITLSDEGHVVTMRDNGTQVHRFRHGGARRLGISPAGVLAVLSGPNTVVLYRQAGVRWVELRRHKLEGSQPFTTLLPLGSNRWVAHSFTGLVFFSDSP
ncbi:hypothetical protein KKD52_14305 [Myxococcota bacterium]|nr:hypothetical protein [Myxococcota bacterium]MBU1412700.1 hypothetical protein [Myxococcota bacterium]MBU1511525.1 hypothetical protein [Myxococcota bacterium]